MYHHILPVLRVAILSVEGSNLVMTFHSSSFLAGSWLMLHTKEGGRGREVMGEACLLPGKPVACAVRAQIIDLMITLGASEVIDGLADFLFLGRFRLLLCFVLTQLPFTFFFFMLVEKRVCNFYFHSLLGH